MANNTFGDQAREEAGLFGGRPPNAETLDGGSASCYMEGDDVRVVVVRVKEGRIADWKGGVKDWQIIDDEERVREAETDFSTARGRREDNMAMVNGIIH